MIHPYPDHFARTESRGCGQRKAGGVYLECGLSPIGTSPEQLMYDPARLLLPGLDLANKAQIFQRVREVRDPLTQEIVAGELVFDPVTGKAIYDVYIHVGKEHYPSLADFVEEARELGISRRVPANLKLELLTRSSYMFLVHPYARIRDWQALLPPRVCRCHEAGHDLAWFAAHEQSHTTHIEEWHGPCVFKVWEVIPEKEACEVSRIEGMEPIYSRRIGKTDITYPYFPTGERVSKNEWEAGIFMRVQLTGAALVRIPGEPSERDMWKEDEKESLEMSESDANTTESKEEALRKEAEALRVNVHAYRRLMNGVKEHGEKVALPFYEIDK